jgi:hypothetical protein
VQASYSQPDGGFFFIDCLKCVAANFNKCASLVFFATAKLLFAYTAIEVVILPDSVL